MERKPMKRNTPLKRTAFKPKRKSYAVPTDVYQSVLARDRGCVAMSSVREVQCEGRIDPHHVIRKSQGGKDVPENLISLCRAHHDWVHGNPLKSYSLGYLKHGWEE